MAEESIGYELEVDKKSLEQLFNEKECLTEDYNKLLDNRKSKKVMEKEMKKLEKENENLLKLNKVLTEENNNFRATIKKMERQLRIEEEKNKSLDLSVTESKLLKMKLNKVETEKNRIAEQYEEETNILDNLLRDKSSLEKIQDELNETTKNFIDVSEELKKTKKQLMKVEIDHKQIDIDKLSLEQQVKNLTRKLRLEEEKNKSNDLAQVECKLLKLKLHAIENEKHYLLAEFERERKIITKQNKPRIIKLEENLKHLRKWIEKEARERRPETAEVKALKTQIHTLENDKIDLIEGFELERKVFRKILKNHGNYVLP